MHDWVEKLLALQEKDLRIAKLEEQVRSAPTEKKRVGALEIESQAAVARAKEELQDEEKRLNSLEMDVETERKRMREFQAKSSMIKDNHTYTAALVQIAECAKKVSGLEDQELVIMEEREASRNVLNQREKELVATRTRVSEMVADLDTRVANCTAQLEKLRAARKSAAAAVDTTILRKYDRLRKSKKGNAPDAPVFVPIRADVCNRCRMNVIAQIRMDTRNGKTVTCENCGAFLYWED